MASSVPNVVSALRARARRQKVTMALHLISVAYFNMKRLLERLDLKRLQGHAVRLLDRLAKTVLLTLEDFGMKDIADYFGTRFLKASSRPGGDECRGLLPNL